MSGRKVLVTGSSGLIGDPLVRALREHAYEVHGVSRTASPGPFAHRADLSVREQAHRVIRDVDPAIIVHLAGGNSPDAATVYEANVLITKNVLQAMERLPLPPALVTAGSSAEYGDPRGGIASEDTCPQPLTEYGRAKLEASDLARAVGDQMGARVCVIRPFNVVSPDLPPTTALGNMRRQLLVQRGNHRVVSCGRVDVYRDFVPLDFVVGVIVRLLETVSWPSIVNVCSGVAIQLRDVLLEMGSHVGADVRIDVSEELAAIPAPARIVGDPSILRELGMRCEPTPGALARIMMSPARREEFAPQSAL